jgi:hypothetical protein
MNKRKVLRMRFIGNSAHNGGSKWEYVYEDVKSVEERFAEEERARLEAIREELLEAVLEIQGVGEAAEIIRSIQYAKR